MQLLDYWPWLFTSIQHKKLLRSFR